MIVWTNCVCSDETGFLCMLFWTRSLYARYLIAQRYTSCHQYILIFQTVESQSSCAKCDRWYAQRYSLRECSDSHYSCRSSMVTVTVRLPHNKNMMSYLDTVSNAPVRMLNVNFVRYPWNKVSFPTNWLGVLITKFWTSFHLKWDKCFGVLT